MSLRIIEAGMASSVQDLGRAGHRHHGVPLSGAADRLSLALANYCVGNSASCAGIEITLTGPSLKFERDISFAICGASANATLNGKGVAINQGYMAKAGDTLVIGALTRGVRAYLAVGGGIDVPKVLGSRAAYKPASFGGHAQGRNLKSGDYLSLNAGHTQLSGLPRGAAQIYSNDIVLRVMIGPEYAWLSSASQNAVFKRPYSASRQTDRMGTRLKGRALTLTHKAQMSSNPILPGTLQCPPDGEPILMLADGHCTGGYPRIAQVIRADRYLLGQIGPRVRLHFARLDSHEADDTLRRRSAFYQSFMPDFSF